MYHKTLLVGACMAIAAMAKSYYDGVGYVFGGDSRFYYLEDTGERNVTQISHQLWEDMPIRPICFYVAPFHTCSFYEPGVEELGPLIGTFEGPTEGKFQDEYAVWYSCRNTHALNARQVRVNSKHWFRMRMNERHWPHLLDNKPCGFLQFEGPSDPKKTVHHYDPTKVYGRSERGEQ